MGACQVTSQVSLVLSPTIPPAGSLDWLVANYCILGPHLLSQHNFEIVAEALTLVVPI